MKKNLIVTLFGLLFISSAITGYVTFELRLHEEYQDYREHLYLECFYCPSLACSISSRYHFMEWARDDYYEISLSPWVKKILQTHSDDVLYNADATCRHAWNRQFVNVKNVVIEMWPVCFMPLKYFQVQKLLTYLFYTLCLLTIISLGHLFLINTLRNKLKHLLFLTFWGLMSVLVLAFCTSFPVGVPVTAFLREYRILSKRLSEGPSAMGTRVEYLLSNEVFIEMDKYTTNYIPHNYNGDGYLNSSEVRERAFPFRHWKRAQARLAVAVAQYDAVMAGKFFYGPDFASSDNLTNLTTRLDKQLVDLNRRPVGNVKTIIEQIKIRREGVIDVLWTEYGMPENSFLTTYKLYYLKNEKIWIPIRNVCEGSFYTYEYRSIAKLITW